MTEANLESARGARTRGRWAYPGESYTHDALGQLRRTTMRLGNTKLRLRCPGPPYRLTDKRGNTGVPLRLLGRLTDQISPTVTVLLNSSNTPRRNADHAHRVRCVLGTLKHGPQATGPPVLGDDLCVRPAQPLMDDPQPPTLVQLSGSAFSRTVAADSPGVRRYRELDEPHGGLRHDRCAQTSYQYDAPGTADPDDGCRGVQPRDCRVLSGPTAPEGTFAGRWYDLRRLRHAISTSCARGSARSRPSTRPTTTRTHRL